MTSQPMLPLRRRLQQLFFFAVALFCFVIAAPATEAQVRRWTPIGPNYGTVLTMAHLPSDNSVMLAGTYFGGLYRSSNWGYSWAAVDTPFSSAAVFCLALDETVPGRGYAGLFQEGVWRTDDAGLNWRSVSSSLSNATVQAIAIDPRDSNRLFAGTASGLFSSVDAGATWAAVPVFKDIYVRTIAIDSRQPKRMVAGTTGTGIYQSTDSGVTWNLLTSQPGLSVISNLNFDAAGALYAATNTGVFQLPAGSTQWGNLSFNLPSEQPVEQIVPHPTVPNVLMAATRLGTYVIANWKDTPKWFLWHDGGSRFIATDRLGQLVHVAGQIASVILTADFGGTWSAANAGLQTGFVGGMASVADNAYGQGWRMIAATELGVMSRGLTDDWSLKLSRAGGVFDIHARDADVYAGTEGNGVWKSVDRGQTWRSASDGIVPRRLSSIAQTFESQPTLFAATASGAYRSIDAGANWTQIAITQISYVLSIAPDPVRAPIVWLSAGGGRVLRSIDRGTNFADASNGLPNEDIVELVHAPWYGVYAITASGLVYSTQDNGQSWFAIANVCGARVTSLAVDSVRSWIVYAATRDAGVCKSESGGLLWAPANTGLTQLGMTSIWIDPVNPDRLWVGALGRVFRSTTAGATWTADATGLPEGAVTSLRGVAGSADRLYAIVYGAGLFESIDAGGRWALRSSAPLVQRAFSLLPDSVQTATVRLGTEAAGILVSTNGGADFTASNRGMTLFVRSIASDPTNANLLYAGTLGGGVFRSSNGGEVWSPAGLDTGNIFRVRTFASDRVYAGTSNGVQEQTTSNSNWQLLGQRAAYPQSIVVDPSGSGYLWVGTTAGNVWVNDNAQGRWRSVSQRLPRGDVLAMTSCPDGTIYAAPESFGVYSNSLTSPDGWTFRGQPGPAETQIVSLACDPRSGFLYAATNKEGVFLSSDRGANWTAINQGLVGRIMTTVVLSPTTPWTAFAAVRDGGVYRSLDGGLAWSRLEAGLSSPNVSQLVIANDETAYATVNNRIYRLDGSSTWQLASTGLPAGAIASLWANPSRAEVLLAAVVANGVFVSADRGATWSPLPVDLTQAPVSLIAGFGPKVVIGTVGAGVAISADGGTSFSAVQPFAAIPKVVADIAVDATDANTIYLAAGGQGVLSSRNRGEHWRDSNGNLGAQDTLCMVAHPKRSGEVFVGTRKGVFRSRDYGTTWVDISAGLVNKNITALVFDSVFPDLLFVGIEGGGVAYLETTP